MQKKLSVKAAAVKAAAAGKPVQVVAADTSQLSEQNAYRALNALELRSHVCASCGTTMATDLETPLCVTCGGTHVQATGKPVKASFVSDASLVSVTCSHCSTASVMEASVVRAAKGSVHCTVCGSSVQADLSSFSDGDVDPTMSTTPISVEGDDDSDGDDEVSVDDLDDNGEDVSATDWLEGPVETELEPALEPSLDFDPAGGLPLLDEQPDMLADAPGLALASDVDPGDVGYAGEDQRIEVESDADDAAEEELGDDDLGPDEGEAALTCAGLDDTAKGLRFASVAGSVLALKGAVSVGVLTKAAAKQNADVMHTDAFIGAVLTDAQRIGVKASLAKYGFQLVRVGNVQNAAVARQVQAAKVQAATARASEQKVFAESLALAAAGLARRHWRGHQNPLATAMNEQLATLGVRNPDAVTTRLLARAGVEYTKVLCTVAEKLGSMSAAARKEFAEALDMTNDAPDDDEAILSNGDDLEMEAENYTTDDLPGVLEDPVSASLTARLARPGRVSTASAIGRAPTAISRDTRVRLSASAQAVLSGRGLGFAG